MDALDLFFLFLSFLLSFPIGPSASKQPINVAVAASTWWSAHSFKAPLSSPLPHTGLWTPHHHCLPTVKPTSHPIIRTPLTVSYASRWQCCPMRKADERRLAPYWPSPSRCCRQPTVMSSDKGFFLPSSLMYPLWMEAVINFEAQF